VTPRFPSGRAFCDTSFFFAALAPRDVNHARARDLMTACADEGIALHTTRDVVSETATLLTYRLDRRAGVAFLDDVKPALAIVPTTSAVLSEAEAVFRRFAPRMRLSFCDAVSVVVLTSILRDAPCLTYDGDFAALGLTVMS
jgi:predicted nucleic acid-binding protein